VISVDFAWNGASTHNIVREWRKLFNAAYSKILDTLFLSLAREQSTLALQKFMTMEPL
jgi:hypothetical protein